MVPMWLMRSFLIRGWRRSTTSWIPIGLIWGYIWD
jgi:hypothetical protein